MRRVHVAALALSIASLGGGGVVGWKVWNGRKATAAAAATPTATATPTTTTTATPNPTSSPISTSTDGGDHAGAASPAEREAALLKALDEAPTTAAHATAPAGARAPSPAPAPAPAPAPEPDPFSPASREAKLLRAMELTAAVGGPSPALRLPPISIRPKVPRISAEARTAADTAAELRAAFEARGKGAPLWPPLDESEPPPGPRLDHAARPAPKVARARAAAPIEVPEKLDRWGE